VLLASECDRVGSCFDGLGKSEKGRVHPRTAARAAINELENTPGSSHTVAKLATYATLHQAYELDAG